MVIHMWDAYVEFGEGDRSVLPAEQQGLFAILDLRQEVNSGGFDSYFRYWGGDTAVMALGALPGTLGDDWAGVLKDGMSLFGDEYPTDVDAREQLIEELSLNDAFDALDTRFYELEGRDDADSILASAFK